MFGDPGFDDTDPRFKQAQASLDEAVCRYVRAVNEIGGHRYLVRKWLLLVEGVLMDQDNCTVVLSEPSQPLPSAADQLGLLRYAVIRHEAYIASDD